MSSYLIKPYDQIIVYKINRIQIVVNSLELDIKANITTNFYDQTGMIRRTEFFVLEGDDYINWTTDDYLLNFVCQKYGIELES